MWAEVTKPKMANIGTLPLLLDTLSQPHKPISSLLLLTLFLYFTPDRKLQADLCEFFYKLISNINMCLLHTFIIA
jgi:hypothetical protein